MDSIFLKAVRGKIGILRIKKKILSRRCGVSRSAFSLMLSGDLAMPEAVQNRLIQELDLNRAWQKLSASAGIGEDETMLQG